MRLLPLIALSLIAAPVSAGEISSAYTDLDTARDCVTFSAAAEGEGDWADMVCSGYRGYPVLIYYDDARESLFYGFPPGGDLAPAWESFSAFNSSGPKIEWRIDTDGDLSVPFAAINRWSVGGEPDKKTEVLVVSKVGQLAERSGCVVGLVVATGNPAANEAARRIADTSARNFDCESGTRTVIEGKAPLPHFERTRD